MFMTEEKYKNLKIIVKCLGASAIRLFWKLSSREWIFGCDWAAFSLRSEKMEEKANSLQAIAIATTLVLDLRAIVYISSAVAKALSNRYHASSGSVIADQSIYMQMTHSKSISAEVTATSDGIVTAEKLNILTNVGRKTRNGDSGNHSSLWVSFYKNHFNENAMLKNAQKLKNIHKNILMLSQKRKELIFCWCSWVQHGR